MMKRALLIGGLALGLSSSLALASPEDLLPPIFNNPPPPPQPTQTARPAQPAPPPPVAQPGVVAPAPVPGTGPGPVIQPLPDSLPTGPQLPLPEGFPSLAELEEMDEQEINELFGLKAKFDVPPAARRALARIGVISSAEGGFPSQSLAGQPAKLVRAALTGTKGPMVSRWGHILMRRALASRLDAPDGMTPVEFAALRASVLNMMGEPAIARALVQDVDSDNYESALTDAAFDAYLGTGDILGMCPVARLKGDIRDDGDWVLLSAVCSAYLGEERYAERRLNRALGTGEAPEIDVRLAQRYAGAAGDGGRAVNVEWDGVEELTPWRFALARALGADLPEALQQQAAPRFRISDALIPAVALSRRVEVAPLAGRRGVLSSAAMVDLYSQLYASDVVDGEAKQPGRVLREAYVAADPEARLDAMRVLWGDERDYGALVLTAYAAARLPVSEDLAVDAEPILASMLSAGLDRNAQRWSSVIERGSPAWGLLVFAQWPQAGQVDRQDVDSYIDDDDSDGQRKSKLLLAGLAGLGKVDADTVSDFSSRLDMNLTRNTVWSQRIDRAAQVGNPALVALLAGVGMQGSNWDMMTPRHLFHIVRALNQVGLNAEARMIAAEAMARG